MAFIGLPAIAPQLAQAYGLPVYLIGYQASVATVGLLIAMVFCANFASRMGGARTIQLGLGLLAAGTLLASLGSLPLLVVGSLGLGFGYGLLTPAGSQMLFRFTPAHRRNVIFSLKQCGVPLGAVLAGTLGPVAAMAAGWQAALWLYAAMLAAALVLFQIGRRHWDEAPQPSVPLFSRPLSAITLTWVRPAIRSLAFGCFFLNAMQSVLFAYTVTLFHEEHGLSLIQAGLFLTVAQAGGICGRLLWGWIADRSRDCAGTLIVIAGLAGVTALALGTLPPGSPNALLAAVFFVFGLTVSGWNGVYLGELARMAPPEQIGIATSGGLLFVNTGYLLAPLLFAAAYSVLHSYSVCFALLSVPGALAMTLLYFARARARLAARP